MQFAAVERLLVCGKLPVLANLGDFQMGIGIVFFELFKWCDRK